MSRYIDADKQTGVQTGVQTMDKKEYYKDCITKGVAQEVVKDVFRVDTITQEIIDTCMKCMTAIKNAPTADVRENVKGYWKKRKDKPLQNWYQCSNCGAICGETPKYCSECGADMRGEAWIK